jgi:hypothetical protein
MSKDTTAAGELSPTTNRWRVVFQGCNHEQIMSDADLHSPIETRFNPQTLRRENVYVCNGCAGNTPDHRVKPGFCHNTILHSVQKAEKVTPLDDRRRLV